MHTQVKRGLNITQVKQLLFTNEQVNTNKVTPLQNNNSTCSGLIHTTTSECDVKLKNATKKLISTKRKIKVHTSLNLQVVVVLVVVAVITK